MTASELWTPLPSMIGVLVGGGLTFVTYPLDDSLEPSKLAFIAAATESLTGGAARPGSAP